mmetsp:Transcript_771/g.1882  ORF Transcript_771/g.1882 Transcript_771/m.1882 type:complete len:213 (-) Transcript_771:681-1319(-)
MSAAATLYQHARTALSMLAFNRETPSLARKCTARRRSPIRLFCCSSGKSILKKDWNSSSSKTRTSSSSAQSSRTISRSRAVCNETVPSLRNAGSVRRTDASWSNARPRWSSLSSAICSRTTRWKKLPLQLKGKESKCEPTKTLASLSAAAAVGSTVSRRSSGASKPGLQSGSTPEGARMRCSRESLGKVMLSLCRPSHIKSASRQSTFTRCT